MRWATYQQPEDMNRLVAYAGDDLPIFRHDCHVLTMLCVFSFTNGGTFYIICCDGYANINNILFYVRYCVIHKYCSGCKILL